jgi:hypothetical protein
MAGLLGGYHRLPIRGSSALESRTKSVQTIH